MSGVITIGRDAQNYTSSYACQQLVEVNKLQSIDTIFYFDLAYKGDFNTTLEVIKSNILDEVAITFGLNNGYSCLSAPVGTLWLISVASGTYDIDAYYPRCLDLTAKASENCVVVRGQVTALPVGTSTDNSFIVTSIAQAIQSGTVTKGTSDRVAFLGTTLDQSSLGSTTGSGGDTIASIGAQNQSTTDHGGRSITILGGFLVAGFCFLLMGVSYFLYQRRKRYVTARDVELALSKSDSMVEHEAHTLQQDAMSDDMADGTAHSLTGSNGSHAPDLSQSLRNEMMGVHARHTDFMNSSIPRSMDDISDAGSGSDADSWAQTDGTIGSLELQLDPITAEV